MERNLRLNWQELVKEAVRRRKSQGMTQHELAMFVGLSKPTVNSFEQGKTKISLENALKILKVLGLSE